MITPEINAPTPSKTNLNKPTKALITISPPEINGLSITIPAPTKHDTNAYIPIAISIIAEMTEA